MAALQLAAVISVSASADAVSIEDLSGYSVANGNVAAASFTDLTAPYSGTLKTFDLSAGDSVEEGDILFEMLTSELIAPEDGTVKYIFASEGDSADSAVLSYGSLAAIEPAREKRLNCTYENAYDDEKNKKVHVGDILYFRDGAEKGTCMVVSVSGDTYIAEILTGSFKVKDSFSLYRFEDRSSESKTGTGRVFIRDDIQLQASGRVAEIKAAAGTAVKKGDVVLTLMSADASADASPYIRAENDGTVGQIFVSPGQQVWKGEVLARVYDKGDYEITADIDEIDAAVLCVGDRLYYTLDTEENRIYIGTVTEISEFGVTKQNAAYYTVHLAVQERDLMLGQSASVYIP